ncbi:MAG: hypothetical protein ACE367_02075 [Acidimicrobiales bacterium]
MADEPEFEASIELTPESVQALQDLVAGIDNEVEGFQFGKERKAPILEGRLRTFIADRPVTMPVTFEPKGIVSGHPWVGDV